MTNATITSKKYINLDSSFNVDEELIYVLGVSHSFESASVYRVGVDAVDINEIPLPWNVDAVAAEALIAGIDWQKVFIFEMVEAVAKLPVLEVSDWSEFHDGQVEEHLRECGWEIGMWTVDSELRDMAETFVDKDKPNELSIGVLDRLWDYRRKNPQGYRD